MVIIYTILSAVAGMALVVIVDMLITKIFDEKSILQKNCIKMPLSYFIGILLFICIRRWPAATVAELSGRRAA